MKQKQPEQAPVVRSAVEAGVATPQQLLERTDLTRAQKIEMLRQWEQDLRECMVADDENMPSAEVMTVSLDEVLLALEALDATPDEHPVPTTHG